MRTPQVDRIRRGSMPSNVDINQIRTQVNQLAGSAGPGFSSGPYGIAGKLDDPDSIWAVVQGSGSGSGSGSGNAPEIWMHAWNAIRFVNLETGEWEIDDVGLFGTETVNPLCNLRYSAIEEGTVVRAWRGPADLFWVCAEGAEEGSGSGGNTFTVTCNSDGTVTVH